MRGNAMRKLCDRLTGIGERLSAYRALEFFARSGDWQATAYVDRVASLTAWEIDPKFERELRNNLPRAEIVICDSFDLARRPENQRRFEFIVLDNPQNVYGAGYCEHFEALELTPRLLSNSGVIVFNVNRCPFGYDQHPMWQRRRAEYYRRDAAALGSQFLLEFYAQRFGDLGFSVRFSFEQQRNAEYLSYLVFGVSLR